MRTDMHGGPTMTAPTESSGTKMSRGRRAAWAAGAFLLTLPLIAMQFTSEVVWTPSDFIFAAVLIFGALGAYEAAVRWTPDVAYRAALGMAVVGGLLLVWSVAAVGFLDGPRDLVFGGVLSVGLVGALLARFRARGMAYAAFAMALAMAAAGGGAVLTGHIPAYNTPFQMLGITGFFFALWVASAGLFWESARTQDEQAGP